jgi:hypothetical protein
MFQVALMRGDRNLARNGKTSKSSVAQIMGST